MLCHGSAHKPPDPERIRLLPARERFHESGPDSERDRLRELSSRRWWPAGAIAPVLKRSLRTWPAGAAQPTTTPPIDFLSHTQPPPASSITSPSSTTRLARAPDLDADLQRPHQPQLRDPPLPLARPPGLDAALRRPRPPARLPPQPLLLDPPCRLARAPGPDADHQRSHSLDADLQQPPQPQLLDPPGLLARAPGLDADLQRTSQPQLPDPPLLLARPPGSETDINLTHKRVTCGADLVVYNKNTSAEK